MSVENAPLQGITLYSHADDFRSHWIRYVLAEKQIKHNLIIADNEDEDLASLNPYNQLPMMIENFTIILGNQTASSIDIQILWEHTAVQIPVVADIDSKIMAQINTAMTVDSRPYYQAASYYFDNGKDINKALEWATKAAEAQPTAYWVMHLKAKVQAKAGDKAGAKATAMKSMEMAKQAKNDDYVVLNQKLIATL